MGSDGRRLRPINVNLRTVVPPPPEIDIQFLTPDQHEEWDAFVLRSPGSTFFHLSGWQRVIERTFNHKAYFLCAKDDTSIKGVLPLGHVKSLLFGNALISSPFAVYGGIVSECPVARAALERAAQGLADSLNVDYLELRDTGEPENDWPVKNQYVTFRQQLHPDPEENLRKIPRKQRAMIRKGIKRELVSTFDEDCDDLYSIYAQSVRNLGTPVFSKRFMQNLCEEFKENASILTIRAGGHAVASVLNFYFRDEVLPYYGGGSAAARSLSASDFMYWELMRHSCERGIQWFDFGRSKIDSGSYRFKKHWGFEPQPLYYRYYLSRGRQMPNVSPANPKYKAMIAVWRRLPIPVANAFGPMVSRYLA